MSAGPVARSEWPHDGLESVPFCPACDSGARDPLYQGVTDRSYLCAPGRWDLFRCRACSSAYLDPRPNAQTVGLAYATYYEGASTERDEPGVATRRLRRAVRNGYLNARYGYRLRPSFRLGRILLPLVPRRREEADEFVRHLPLRPGGTPRLLDVGCGDGEFLARMERLGWHGEGIEPSTDAVRLARSRGVKVRHGTFGPGAGFPASSFDAVTFQLVLEHLPRPADGIAAAYDALRPGGLLWIASPNLEAEGHRRFGSDWIFLEPPRHAVMFTPTALSALVRRHGFEPIMLRPSRRAGWSFRLSTAIARGLPPFREAPPLSLGLRLHAHLADLKALLRPLLAEVVVLVARKH